MERSLSLGLILLLLVRLGAATAEPDREAPATSSERPSRQMVLVTRGDCCLRPLTSLELRKLYLGIRLSVNGCELTPLRNRADEQLDALFVQSVMSMAPRTYERELVSGLLREGRRRPKEFSDQAILMEVLREDPCTVTYMWKRKVQAASDLGIIQSLWIGSTEP